MKCHQLTGLALIAAHHVGYTFAQCQTVYGSTSTKKVPTTTTTKTVDLTRTSSTFTFVTTTSYSTTSYISVVGSKTITVPTGLSFTPLTSAPTKITSFGIGKRATPAASAPTADTVKASSAATTPKPSSSAKSSSKTSGYPKSVVCTATYTRTHVTTTTATSTATETYITGRVSTSRVATSTAYAACNSDNMLTKFDNAYIASYEVNAENVCDGEHGAAGQVACLDVQRCCEGAQRSKSSGFIYFVDHGLHQCGYIQGNFSFDTLYNTSLGYTFGNGPSGSGVFLDITLS